MKSAITHLKEFKIEKLKGNRKIKPISKQKFNKLKRIQKERMIFEDYSYLNSYGGKF